MNRFNMIRNVYRSNPPLYLGATFCVSGLFWIMFNMLDELLYFDPIFYFYVPNDAIWGFVLSTLGACLIGLVISLNVYLLRNSKPIITRSLISGSFLALLSSLCASCSSIGFLLISTFGVTGIMTTNFLTNYQIYLRLLSVFILMWAVYGITGRIVKGCKL